jgi:hypothetical protein
MIHLVKMIASLMENLADVFLCLNDHLCKAPKGAYTKRQLLKGDYGK